MLAQWGFHPDGRVWFHDQLGIAVDLIALDMDRAQEQALTVRVRGRTVHLLRPEEVIVDRLAACVHWNIPEDFDWARIEAEANRGRMDLEYLRRRAEEEGVLEALNNLLADLEDDHGAH